MRQTIHSEAVMSDSKKPKLVGINHVAIEVGDIDEALAWYAKIFDFNLRGKGERNAFIDLGDQFVNLTRVPDYQVAGQ
jgi:catechol 2,3-dioxygenase-like lactoylglutathione lyase family enzyme